jgi:ABC-type microcin C transport system duplicated ATPase subunit YejF
MKPSIDPSLWQNFTIHVDLIRQVDTCRFCGKHKDLNVDKLSITAQTAVALAESIILKFNRMIADIKSTTLVLLAPRQRYEVLVELAKKYEIKILVVGHDERIDIADEKYFELKDIFRANNKIVPIASNPQESLMLPLIQDNIGFRTRTDPAETDYVIGLKSVPVSVTEKNLEELLEKNGCKPIHSKWMKDKKGSGSFVKLFFTSNSLAYKAKTFVYS